MAQKTAEPDIAVLSEAVQRWYRFYEVPLDDDASEALCSAAIGLYREGHRSVEEIATMLIGTYVGIWSTRADVARAALDDEIEVLQAGAQFKERPASCQPLLVPSDPSPGARGEEAL